MILNPQAKKENPIMAGVIDPDYYSKIGLLIHNEVNKNYVRSPENSLGCLLIFLVNKQLNY